jgi:hypothetical protein
MFGKELTNLAPPNPRGKNSYSHIHAEKVKDRSLNPLKPIPHKHNLSLGLKDHQEALPDIHDPQMVPEYFSENIRFLRKQEEESFRAGNYLSSCKHLSEQERGKLIDWMAKLHLKFKMFPETLFAMVSLADQYLSRKEVLLPELQLVGVAALFIAAKFEETYQVPPLKQLVACCAYQYTAAEILAKEADIIRELGFCLIVNSSFRFFDPFSRAIGLEPKNHHLAHYILELSLLQGRFLSYSPSLLAASVVYLIKKIRKSESAWGPSMGSLVGYEERELKSCAKDLCSLLEAAP